MGQKVNPHGLRVGVIKDWESKWFAEPENFADALVEDYKIREFLKKKLYHAGVSKIEIERASDRVKVIIYTAKPGIVIGKGGAEIEKLKAEVQKFTTKKLVVDIKEVKRPDKDAQLVELAQNALKLVTLFIIPLGLQYEMVDSMTALGQVNISLPLSFFRKGVYFVALFLIPVFFSVQYTFAAECISDLIAPVVSFITVKKNLPIILEWRMSMKEEQKVTE